MFALFLKGLIIGFAIAAPVGPIGILCIQRSLHHGFKIGLMTGLGAASADGIYGIIAAFGLTAISSLLTTHQFWIQFIGGLFLVYLGIKLFIAAPPEKAAIKNTEKSAWHAYITSFFLTLTNPATILSFVAVFAGLGLGTIHPDYVHAIFLVLGIVLGSAIWWLVLSSGIAFILHHKMNDKSMQIINWISGSILIAFRVYALLFWR